jgi:hypothetical protein
MEEFKPVKIQSERRKFAARYSYQWQGWTLIVIGVFGVAGSAERLSLYTVFVGLALSAWGVYLLRGVGKKPKAEPPAKDPSSSVNSNGSKDASAAGFFGTFFAAIALMFSGSGVKAKREEWAQKKADRLSEKIDIAKRRLAKSSGGAAVVAHRDLMKVLKSSKNPNVQGQLAEIFEEIEFDPASVVSQKIGSVPLLAMFSTTQVEVFRDWIIAGQQAFDIDSSTRGEVHLDGAIQIDAKGNKHDMRKATLQFVSAKWSHTFPINPDSASDARRIVAQLASITDSQKPAGVTTEDISRMLETILNNTGQPAAEKLQQLSDLRYQRLLSDSEFEAAKARVLGI